MAVFPKTYRHVLILIFIAAALVTSADVRAQQPDSVEVIVDSTAVDTVETAAEMDSIMSGSDRREFDINSKATILYGTLETPAWFEYQDMHLEAYKIIVFGSDSLIAEGIMVEADPDSFPGGFKEVGKPVLTKRGDEPITGKRMVYNLLTKKGAVTDGRTEYQGGYYFGENFTRLDEEYIQIQDGYFTTCDFEDEPHYHFRSSQMKMKVKDKIVAKPVVFYIQDIPLMILPFGVFPLRSGRSSGFILPTYGQSRVEGRFLRGMGYYYAPNDYWDGKVLMDFMDKVGVRFRGDAGYSVRYKMRGRISGSIARLNYENTKSRRWDLTVNHNQTIDPTMNLTVRGTFVSDNTYYKETSLNRDQRAQRRINSSARLDKRWENSPNSLSIQLNRELDLDSDETTEILPSMNFNRSAPIYLFKNTGSGSDRFYHTFNFSYSSELQNKRTRRRTHEATEAITDTLSGEIIEPATADTFFTETRSGMRHNMQFSSPQRFLRHFSVNPSLNLVESWFNEADVKFLGEDNEVVTEKEKGFFRRLTFNTGVSVNTKLYGMFNMNLGSLKTVRHVLTPSVSFTYTPDFSDPRFGYFDTYIDEEEKEVKYDRFERSIYSPTPTSKSRVMSFSVSNLFQARTVKDDVEEKFDFFSVNSSLSHNFNALPGMPKWSTIGSTVRIMKPVDFTLRMTHSLYKYVDPLAEDQTVKLIYDSSKPWYKRGFARLLNVSTSMSFRFSGKGDDSSDEKLGSDESQEGAFSEDAFLQQADLQSDPQARFVQENELSDMSIPWDLSVNLNASYNKRNPNNPTKVLSASVSMNVEVTKNWKMSYRTNLDLVERRLVYQDFQFYRDLHCWELAFNWTPPMSSRPGYFLEIRIKDPKLRDLKVRKTDYGGSSFGFIR